MLIIPLNLDTVLLLLHNSKLAYCFETKYEVAFLRCLCELSNIERKQIIKKHKSTSEIAANWKKEERNLHFNGPTAKNKNFLQILLKITG